MSCSHWGTTVESPYAPRSARSVSKDMASSAPRHGRSKSSGVPACAARCHCVRAASISFSCAATAFSIPGRAASPWRSFASTPSTACTSRAHAWYSGSTSSTSLSGGRP